MNKEKNETQYLKAREVAGYVDYRNHLIFLEECDIDFEIDKQAYSDGIFSLDQIKNNKLACKYLKAISQLFHLTGSMFYQKISTCRRQKEIGQYTYRDDHGQFQKKEIKFQISAIW